MERLHRGRRCAPGLWPLSGPRGAARVRGFADPEPAEGSRGRALQDRRAHPSLSWFWKKKKRGNRRPGTVVKEGRNSPVSVVRQQGGGHWTPHADAEARDARVRDRRTRSASGQQARYTCGFLSSPFFGCSGASGESQRLCIRNVPGERNGPVRAATAPGDSGAHCVLGQGKG